MNKVINFIEHLYESINIYQTLILYDKRDDIIEMKNILNDKDYPVCIIDDNNFQINENKFRVFIINYDVFLNAFLKNNNIDFTKITVILCLDEKSHEQINCYLKNNNINLADELYIFSIDNI